MSAYTYLDVIHVGILELFFEVGVLLEELDDLPEVAVVVQPSVLEQKPQLTSLMFTLDIIENMCVT